VRLADPCHRCGRPAARAAGLAEERVCPECLVDALVAGEVDVGAMLRERAGYGDGPLVSPTR
jgi:NMD protein affecting ribosome stability and mRNA decay